MGKAINSSSRKTYLRDFLNQGVLLAFMLYVVWVMAVAYASYHQEKKKLYYSLNQQLVDAALTTPILLPENLHHKGMSKNDISKKEDYANTFKLSKYTDNTRVIYIYTLILHDDKIFFTTSSATKKERDSGEDLVSFFDLYEDVDPRVYEIFTSKEKAFLEYTDQWGTFRSVFIPQVAPDGYLYLSVADLSIDYIQTVLQQHIYQIVLESGLFLLFACPIYLASTHRVSRIAKKLKIKVQQQTSELMLSEERLQLFARVFNDAHEGIAITDIKGIIIDVNPTFCEITGYSRAEVIGQNSQMLNSGKQSPEFYSEMLSSLNRHSFWQGEIWNRKKNGEVYAELLTVSALKDDNGKTRHYVGLFSDITQIKQQQEKLELMAHYDVLTQLPNRTLFADRFSHLASHSKRTKTLLAICFLDIDNFKPVNDNFGHGVGDTLLIELAERIQVSLREEDTVSRQGGDEFLLLLSELESFPQCEQLLERILYSLSQPYQIDDTIHKISVSIGVTLFPLDDADLDTLVRHADQAMYQAKIAGKNQYKLFNILDDRQTIEKHRTLQKIHKALLKNEFCLYYQPKVNMKTGEVFGVEALIRWNQPNKGVVLPLDFLPVIEQTPVEIEIGEWVINQALKQLDCWKKQGIELEMSVNISSFHLQSELFYTQLDDALAQYPMIDSRNFQLEILETSALGDLNAISNIIEICRNTLGVNIALDDFGTGYSSLTHLRNLFVDVIKIDQSFVRDILDDPSDFAIINGVIKLADSFNRQIIAEGVETINQGMMLLVMGCYKAQGNSIAPAMSAERVLLWLSNYKANEDWITFANIDHSETEKQVKLIILIATQWIDRFQENIQELPENIECWPIIASSKCHCGSWINRVRQDQLFKPKWLNEFDQVHEKMHNIAFDLLLAYQNNEVQAVNKKRVELQVIFEQLKKILKEFE